MHGISGLVALGADAAGDEAAREASRRLRSASLETWPTGRIEATVVGPAILARTALGPGLADGPLTLDGAVWVVADARIDDRESLVRRLDPDLGLDVASSDQGLILGAYHRWGARCAEALAGDFAFVVWDGRSRELLAARDAFGVRPLYWAFEPSTGTLAFASAPAPLRALRLVSDGLDESAVADYLLFGGNQDPSTTAFRGIRRLPAGEVRTWRPDHSADRRHWTWSKIEPDEDTRADWPERFRSALAAAVADRTREGEAAVLLSGGLDSTAVATLAAEAGVALTAHTLGYRLRIPDAEVPWARLTAAALGIRHRAHWLDHARAFEATPVLGVGPQPADEAFDPMLAAIDHEIARSSHVVLTGHGGDPLLWPSGRYFVDALRAGRVGRALGYVLGGLVRRRALPPLGLHRAWRRHRAQRGDVPPMPPWIAPSLVRDLDLERRWQDYWSGGTRRSTHATHPEAAAFLGAVGWSNFFEQQAATVRATPLELRHPFFDRRVVELVLRCPPVPWCLDKHLLRRALRGRAPEEVRRRRKTPLAGDPAHPTRVDPMRLWSDSTGPGSPVLRFVDADRFSTAWSAGTGMVSRLAEAKRRPIHLALWLRRSTAAGGAFMSRCA